MDKVVHFELPADDLVRSKKFYSETFGWETEDFPEMNYVTAITCEMDEKTKLAKEPGGINGGMVDRKDFIKVPSFAIAVDNIEEASERIVKAGGKMLRDKMDIGGGSFIAYFEDTEGNTLSIFQS